MSALGKSGHVQRKKPCLLYPQKRTHHKTAQSYRGYSKETFDRALSATRKRHAHRLANAQSTSVEMTSRLTFRMKIWMRRKQMLSDDGTTRNVGWGARIRTWEWRRACRPCWPPVCAWRVSFVNE